MLSVKRFGYNSTFQPSGERAVTILIHKKGSTDEPGNFRPITLQPVVPKIFTSLMQNRMYEFLAPNKYIESHIQKGFIPGMTGTFSTLVSCYKPGPNNEVLSLL